MGDHRIGEAMQHAATAWWASRSTTPTKDEALAALDAICGPYRGRDAEFEATDPEHPGSVHLDYEEPTDPEGPIGRLIAIAFNATPEEMSLGDEDECPWLDGVGTVDAGPYARFRNRYQNRGQCSSQTAELLAGGVGRSAQSAHMSVSRVA